MTLKLDEGLKEVGLTKVEILRFMIVDAGKKVVDMPLMSKYWTELIDKGVTGQLWNEVAVLLI